MYLKYKGEPESMFPYFCNLDIIWHMTVITYSGEEKITFSFCSTVKRWQKGNANLLCYYINWKFYQRLPCLFHILNNLISIKENQNYTNSNNPKVPKRLWVEKFWPQETQQDGKITTGSIKDLHIALWMNVHTRIGC